MVDYRSAVGLFVMIYLIAALILRSRKPTIPIWSLMAFSSFVVIVSGLVSIDELGNVIDVNVVLFLIGMFSIVGLMDVSGLLDAISYWFMGRFKSRTMVLIASAYLFGLLAAVTVNDTVALMGPPIALLISRATGTNLKVIAVLLMFSLTIGSAMTPIGNPQNVLIAIDSGMPAPFIHFIAKLFVPTMINLLLTTLVVKKYYKVVDAEVSINLIPHEAIKDKRDAVLGALGLVLTVTTLIINDVLELYGYPHIRERGFIPFVISAGLYPLTSNPRKVLSNVDWGTIIFFITMFITTAGIWRSGNIELIFQLFLPDINDKLLVIIGITLTSITVSQLVSNVPFVGLYIHHLESLGFTGSDTSAWLTLAVTSTVAGNLTILGAASNIIVLEALESRFSVTVTFKEFVKVGSIVTAVNILVYLPFLYLTI